MSFIVSRPSLPTAATEMEASPWFILWKVKRPPIGALATGDTLWWYDATQGAIVWETTVSAAGAFEYSSKQDAAHRIQDQIGPFNENEAYFINGPEAGVGMAWRVGSARRVHLPRPVTLRRFPQQGWLGVSTAAGRLWLSTEISHAGQPSAALGVPGLTSLERYSRAQVFGAFGLAYRPQDQHLNTGLSPKMPDGGYCIFITLDKSSFDEPSYAYEDVLDADSLTWVTRRDCGEAHSDYVSIRSGARTSLFVRAKSREDFVYLGELQYRTHLEMTDPDGRLQQQYLFTLPIDVSGDLLSELTGHVSQQPRGPAIPREPAGRKSADMSTYRQAFAYAVDRIERVLEPRHQHYQVRLRQYLEGRVSGLEWERDFVDVRFLLGTKQYIGEIKVTGLLRLEEAFRTALGQLLEYSHLKFAARPAMVMLLDAQLDLRRLQLADRLGISVVVEQDGLFQLQVVEGALGDEQLRQIFPTPSSTEPMRSSSATGR